MIKIGGKNYRTTKRFNTIIATTVMAASFVTTTAFIPAKEINYSTVKPQLVLDHPYVSERAYFLKYENKIVRQEIIDTTTKIEPKILSMEVEPEVIEPEVIEQKVVEQKKELVILTKKEIAKLDLRQPSGLTAEQIDKIVKGTGLEGLGWAFIKGEELYGVNALYAVSHAALESEWGKSNISKTKNNIFGFQAYDDSPGKSAYKFKTKADCILHVMKYVSKNYLNEDGQHYNGNTLKGMNVKYASDNEWADKIASVMVFSQKKIKKATSV